MKGDISRKCFSTERSTLEASMQTNWSSPGLPECISTSTDRCAKSGKYYSEYVTAPPPPPNKKIKKKKRSSEIHRTLGITLTKYRNNNEHFKS